MDSALLALIGVLGGGWLAYNGQKLAAEAPARAAANQQLLTDLRAGAIGLNHLVVAWQHIVREMQYSEAGETLKVRNQRLQDMLNAAIEKANEARLLLSIYHEASQILVAVDKASRVFQIKILDIKQDRMTDYDDLEGACLEVQTAIKDALANLTSPKSPWAPRLQGLWRFVQAGF